MLLVLVTLLAAGCGVQPSGVIWGGPAVRGPAEGVSLYLVRNGTLALVIRPVAPDLPPTEVLRLLAAGPTVHERREGFTSEVPADAVPTEVAPSADGAHLVVTLSSPVTTLSVHAVRQILCTVDRAAASAGQVVTVTLHGSDGHLSPQSCPN